MKLFKKWKRKSLYKKSLTIFTVILLALGISFLVYVFNSMIIYERNLVDNYIEYLAESGKLSKNVNEDIFEISKYEDENASIEDGVKELLRSEDLTIKKNKELSNEKIFAYDIKIEDKVISTVSLKSVDSYTRMAILKIDEWEVTEIKTYFEDGLYNYEINIPTNYKVYINGNEVKEEDIESTKDVEGLERLTEYIEIEKSNYYIINGLVYEPEIKILDEKNKEVKFKINNDKISVNKDFKEISSYEDAKQYIKDDFNVLELAENWSLFLTDDLGGSEHGFYKFTPYLIENSYMYEMAYGWSHNVDIRFVSSHYLKNPVFTNEKVENFIIYNDNAFSCEVYLEKNMVVSGKDKVDIMHDRLYFIYYNGGYKLVNMESI